MDKQGRIETAFVSNSGDVLPGAMVLELSGVPCSVFCVGERMEDVGKGIFSDVWAAKSLDNFDLVRRLVECPGYHTIVTDMWDISSLQFHLKETQRIIGTCTGMLEINTNQLLAQGLLQDHGLTIGEEPPNDKCVFVGGMATTDGMMLMAVVDVWRAQTVGGTKLVQWSLALERNITVANSIVETLRDITTELSYEGPVWIISSTDNVPWTIRLGWGSGPDVIWTERERNGGLSDEVSGAVRVSTEQVVYPLLDSTPAAFRHIHLLRPVLKGGLVLGLGPTLGYVTAHGRDTGEVCRRLGRTLNRQFSGSQVVWRRDFREQFIQQVSVVQDTIPALD